MKDKFEKQRLAGLRSGAIEAEKAKERKRLWDLNPKLCKNCDVPISYEKRKTNYCLHSCVASFNNKSRRMYPRPICIECEKEINAWNKKFCSESCNLSHKLKIDTTAFNNGLMREWKVKQHLIKLHGHKCMECGWDKINQYTGKCPVELEHIDGNHKNNNPNNLKLLCPSCHSLTPTYKALNKGNGREYRRVNEKVI